MSRRILLLFMILSVGYGSVAATWKIVFQNPRTDYQFGCSYFLTEKYGFVGEGMGSLNITDPAIFRTVDGGITWAKCVTPKLNGHVSSIIMSDSMNGYASIHCLSFTLRSIVWKTTDAGVTWSDLPQTSSNALTHANCIYPSSRGLVVTTWDISGIAGGVSFDQGATYSQVFTTPIIGNLSNGIAFSTPDIGIVSLRFSGGIAECWTTMDGGLTWTKGGQLKEAWSIYPIKGTQTFYTLPEGEKKFENKDIYFTTDVGKNWNIVQNNSSGLFSTSSFTGHITGYKNTLYVQTEHVGNTNRGLYRSDNLGRDWKAVGGPSSDRDTRFSVTGCNGEVVYVFDTLGNVWKTSDGGDGTLFGGDSTLPPLSFIYDTLNLTSHYCEQVHFGFPLINGSCSDFIFDSIIVTDPSGKFVVLDSLKNILSSKTDSIRFNFQSDSNETQTILIHIAGKGGGKTIDTTLRATVTNISNGVFGPILSLQSALASIRTHYCQPGEVTIPIHNINCSTLKIDTLYLIDSLGESSISYRPLHDSIPIFLDDSIKLSFQTNTNESRTIPLHLKCTIAGRTFDTIIILDAFHSRSPEPYLGEPKPTKVGDTVLVPLYILTPTDSINIKHLAFHLKYNGDLLTPVPSKTFETNNTLCQHNKNLSGSEVSPGNLDCSIDLDKDSIYNLSDFSKPMIYVRFRVTLTTELSCPIFIDSFSIAGRTPLGLCDIPSTTFQLDPRCGDSTIWKFMRTGKIPQIISMHPNPATDNIQIEFEPAGRTSAKVQIVSALGVTIKEVIIPSEAIRSFQLGIASLPSGIYYARMVTEDGAVCSKGFSVEH